MSIVENLIEQISSNNLSGITKASKLNLDDTTFSDLLDKQLETGKKNNPNLFGELGMPCGMQIEPLEGTELAESMRLSLENSQLNTITETTDEEFQIKDIEIGDYFSNILKNPSNEKSPIFTLTKKIATGTYNTFEKSFVNDIESFTEDIIKIAHK